MHHSSVDVVARAANDLSYGFLFTFEDVPKYWLDVAKRTCTLDNPN